jgi:hypothetical protein
MKVSGQADLDADPVLRDRPIILYRKDLHVAWVSSKALELTVPNLPDKIDGGEIHSRRNGKTDGYVIPTTCISADISSLKIGVFLDNAILLVPVPAWSESRASGSKSRLFIALIFLP